MTAAVARLKGAAKRAWLAIKTLAFVYRLPLEAVHYAFSPGSLRRLSRRRRISELVRRRDRIDARWAHRAQFLMSRGLPVLWLSALVIAPTFLAPADWSFAALESRGEARSFLQTLWQVDAAAIAFSLAILLFAYELIWSSQFRGSFSDFSREAWLSLAVALGFAAIFGIFTVLLGFGSGAPGGWAASWAAGWSFLALLSLPLLFFRIIRVVAPDQLHRRRLRQLTEQAQAAVDREYEKRTALEALRDECNRNGVRFQALWFGSPPAGGEYVRAGDRGVVSDIRLRRLRLLGTGRHVENDGAPLPGLLVHLGERVDVTSPIAALSEESARLRRWAVRRIPRVRETRPERRPLAEAIDELHEEALEAIHEGRPGSHSTTSEYYIELLTGYAVAWKRYGTDLKPGVAGEIELLGSGPLEWIFDNLYEELREALKTSNRELARSAAAIPFQASSRAIDLNPRAIVQALLPLYAVAYENARGASDPEIARLITERCLGLPFDLAKYRIHYELTDDGTSSERRDELLGFLNDVYDVCARVVKNAMEAEPRSIEASSKASGNWLELFRTWTPELDIPADWEITRAEQQWGKTGPRTVRLLTRAERLRAAAETKDLAVALHEMQCFGLAYWSLYQLEKTANRDWLKQLDHWANHLTDPNLLVSAAAAAISRRYSPWFFWRSDEETGRFRTPAIEYALTRAMLVLLLRRMPPTLSPPTIDPPEFLRHEMARAEKTLEAIVNDAQLWTLISAPADLARRAVAVRRMLREAHGRL